MLYIKTAAAALIGLVFCFMPSAFAVLNNPHLLSEREIAQIVCKAQKSMHDMNTQARAIPLLTDVFHSNQFHINQSSNIFTLPAEDIRAVEQRSEQLFYNLPYYNYKVVKITLTNHPDFMLLFVYLNGIIVHTNLKAKPSWQCMPFKMGDVY